jgi:hypothetical protein
MVRHIQSNQCTNLFRKSFQKTTLGDVGGDKISKNVNSDY